jgi:threonyl-tRNA synthetase
MSIDHRKLGRELDLFDSDPLIGAGLPFWLPNGAAARHEVEEYLREIERRAGYQHVYSPVIAKRELYQRSGHLSHFADDMFPIMEMSADDAFVMRPSLCPHHALIFKARARSYRDLPLRIAELGPQYRAERSGVLGGLARVRSIFLNDAHNFCALPQVRDEVLDVVDMIKVAHAALGVVSAGFRLSLRGDSEKYAGDAAAWNQAESLLRAALDAAGVAYVVASGEAAFYGPKIDVQIVDPVGRESTLSTIQIDFYQPERFDLVYTDAAGDRVRPVMVHRSVVGSMERLFAYLIEVHSGAFPVWYAPVQLTAVPIGAEQADRANAFARACVMAGLRATASHDGSLGARIREAAGRKIPYVAVIGPREAEHGEVALRLRDGQQLPVMSEPDAIALINEVASTRSSSLLPR